MTGRGWLGLLLAILLVGVGVVAWIRFERVAPKIEGPQALAIGAEGRTISFEISDEGSGLRDVQVVVVHEGGETVAFEKSFPGDFRTGGTSGGLPEVINVRIDPKHLGIDEGEAIAVAVVHDWSWRNGFQGNRAELQVDLRVDLTKPRVQVMSGLTYVGRGGSGAVVYSVAEETVRDGVSVADVFFPGYSAPGEVPGSGRRVALFAVPTDAPPEPTIEVVAEDVAGNVARASWPVVVKERVLPDANVTLPKRFLDTKVRTLADAANIPLDDLEAAFDQINTQLRAENEKTIRQAIKETFESPLWDGSFAQMTNSKVTSRFAEQRTYFVDGRSISKATHFGYDLASTSSAPIHAANDGRVVYADDLGIYGNCVILDHGLGLASLYGHLSRVDVIVGDRVEKGATLGLSGATGLAGGDHLHFAILVGGTYVEPLEWWDPLWVRTHIESRLAPPPAAP